MKKLLYQFDTDQQPSVFDNVVGFDGGADHISAYGGVNAANVGPLVEGAIFTRSPKDKKNTAVFIGGANMREGEAVLAAVQASRDERRHETAVLRVLGAGRGMILRAVITEFSALGALAGMLAASGAAVGGFWLARELGLKYRFDAMIWIVGVASTVALVGLAGWLAARSVINHPPRAALN